MSNLIIVMSSVRVMPPRRDPCSSGEPSFPDVSQLGEAIASAIPSVIRPPQRTILETVYNLKLPMFKGNEGHEWSERWLERVEKTFQVMQSQGSLPIERWVETTSWFLDREPAFWWNQETYGWSPEEKANWENFKRSFYKRFIPLAYLDQKRQEFTNLKQGKLSANEYYKRFTDLSRYDPETTANPVEMLRRFKLGTKKKWRSMATILPCDTYQEFYEIMLRIEDSENMPSMRHNRNRGQSSQGPRQTQSFKKSGASFSSSSGGFSATGQMRGGQIAGGPRFQRPKEPAGTGAPLCRRCNNRHFGECHRGSSGCYTCEQTGHLPKYCPQNPQRLQPPQQP